MKYFLLGVVVLSTVGCANTYYYQGGKKQELEPVKKINRTTDTYDFYKTKSGAKVGVSDTMLVKFRNTANLEFYVKKYNLTILEELIPNLFEIQVANKSMTIDIANELYEQEDIEYAHPNFLQEVQKR